MTKKKLLEIIESFDDNSVILFSEDTDDFRNLDGDESHHVTSVLEANTGITKYIILSE